MRFYKIIYLVFYLLFFCTSVHTVNHYVDKNATGNNNGTSWSNAWESFGAIQWGNVNPGDIVYVSGGTDSTVYYEQLTLSDHGTADARITIRNSWDAGHNGRVIIDRVSNTGHCVYANSAEYMTVKGFELRNAKFNIHIQLANESVIIDSCYIYDWGSFGLRVAENNNGLLNGTIIENCDFISAKTGGDDAMLFTTVDGVIIRNNFIHIRNASQINSHIDGMLGMVSRDFKVYNNIIILDSNTQGQAYILRLASDSGLNDSVIVYNNMFYTGGIWFSAGNPPHTSVVNLRHQDSDGVEPPTYVVHNTIISWGAWYTGTVYETDQTTYVNNVTVQLGTGVDLGQATFWPANQRGSDEPPVDSVRNNLIWREWESTADQSLFTGTWHNNGTSRRNFNWSTWVNILGGTGVNADPLFVQTFAFTNDGGDNQGENQKNIRGFLQSGSPAIGAGEDVQALIESLDIGGWRYIGEHIEGRLGVTLGAIRPISSTPTLGAFDVE
ncbi:MAG: hypothetical protein O6940_03730 [Ignavibacteria bacterium]|nr:hypothetical protein [Ignavibacteria bacterium]